MAAVRDLKGVTAKQLLAGVDASQAGATDIVKISAVDPDPARAALMANAVATAYIVNRKDTAVAGLQKASDELQVKLPELESERLLRRCDDAGGSAQSGKRSVGSQFDGPYDPGTYCFGLLGQHEELRRGHPEPRG